MQANQADRDPFWREMIHNKTCRPGSPGSVEFLRPDVSEIKVQYPQARLHFGTLFEPFMGPALINDEGRIMISDKRVHEIDGPVIIHFSSLGTKLTGSDELSMNTGQATVASIKCGKLEGIVRHFGKSVVDKDSICHHTMSEPGLSFLCRYESGKPVGPCWKPTIGGGYLYGHLSEDEAFTGDNIAWVYPDLELAYLGQFRDGVMVDGEEATVSKVRCNKGIYELQFTTQNEAQRFSYEKLSNVSLGDNPLVQDQLERKYVYLGPSTIREAGQGTFAKIPISRGSTVAQYAGILISPTTKEDYQRTVFSKSDNFIRNTLGIKNFDKFRGKYDINHPKCCRGCAMTLPPEVGEDSALYNATLAHKFNHKFQPNVHLGGNMESARFGLINTFFATRDIAKDEELFVSYGYRPYGNHTPHWYNAMYEASKQKD